LKEMKNGVVRLAIEYGAPILPTIIWGSQRVWTKNVPRDFGRRNYPIFVAIGQPLYVTPESDIDAAMSELTARMTGLLNQVQSDYPDSPIGERWAPARLGGTAPTPQEIQARKSQRKEL
jgi:1-acyl-sn-glycerol-3-phosphate acyltransferase